MDGLATNTIEDFAKTTMFSPIQVGSLTLKNRLIKSAATSMVSDDEQKAVAYHGRIAAGGMGAVLIEGSYDMLARLDKRTVSAAGQSSGRLTIEESPLQAICAEVHSHDCPCLIQMKTATPGIVYQWENMGPEGETHKASLLSDADIQMYIEDTIDGAARLQAIGFDVTVPLRLRHRCVRHASRHRAGRRAGLRVRRLHRRRLRDPAEHRQRHLHREPDRPPLLGETFPSPPIKPWHVLRVLGLFHSSKNALAESFCRFDSPPMRPPLLRLTHTSPNYIISHLQYPNRLILSTIS